MVLFYILIAWKKKELQMKETILHSHVFIIYLSVKYFAIYCLIRYPCTRRRLIRIFLSELSAFFVALLQLIWKIHEMFPKCNKHNTYSSFLVSYLEGYIFLGRGNVYHKSSCKFHSYHTLTVMSWKAKMALFNKPRGTGHYEVENKSFRRVVITGVSEGFWVFLRITIFIFWKE